MIFENVIFNDDLFSVVPKLPNNSIDLVLTSPPYAMQRKNQYSSIDEKEYPDWTVAWMEAIKPALKSSGNVAIVIRTHIRDGEISDYVLRTRLAVREAGWIECEELLWIKSTAAPLGSIYRPRRSFENILWFSPSRKPYCNPQANGEISNRLGLHSGRGIGDWISETGYVGEGLARCRDWVDVPTHKNDQDSQNTHPAQFPVELAEWIARLLCPSGGVILDPFMGSGSTAIAAKRNGFVYTGTEIDKSFFDISQRRLAETESSECRFSNQQDEIVLNDGLIILPRLSRKDQR